MKITKKNETILNYIFKNGNFEYSALTHLKNVLLRFWDKIIPRKNSLILRCQFNRCDGSSVDNIGFK